MALTGHFPEKELVLAVFDETFPLSSDPSNQIYLHQNQSSCLPLPYLSPLLLVIRIILILHLFLSTTAFVKVNAFRSNFNGRHFRWAFVYCGCPRDLIGQNQLVRTIPPRSNTLSSMPLSETIIHFHSRSDILSELLTSSSVRP